MFVCSRCGTTFDFPGNYCSRCGQPMVQMVSQPIYPPFPPRSVGAPQFQSRGIHPHAIAARGFAQVFGLHPAMAFLTFIVDTMLFGGEVMTVGGILPLSITAGAILGIITYKAQLKWYGDDKESAMIKGFILAFLTAIPTNIPAFIYVPAGIVGLFRHKKT